MDRRGAVACACLPEPGLGDWLRVGLGLVISGQLMLLSLAINLSSIQAMTRERIDLAVLGLTTLGVALLGPELVHGLRLAWRRREASLEAMFALAFVGGLGASLMGMVTGGPVFFEVITVVLCVHAVGMRLKARFWANAIDRIDETGLFPQLATRVDADAQRQIAVAALRSGDVVVVYEGERVPASGSIVEGAAWADTDGHDGSRVPRWVQAGDDLPAGASIRGGTLRLRVDEVGAAQLNLTRDAMLAAFSEAPPPGLAGRWVKAFVPVVIFAALVSGLVWAVISGPRDGFVVATSVLLVACPCGFGLATPVATWAAATQLAAHGVRVRRPAALEALASATTIVLDKTGTLTELVPRGASAQGRVGAWVGALQQWFDHPIAKLLWRGGAEAPPLRDVRTLPTGGVAASVLDQDGWRALRVAPMEGRRDLGVWVEGGLASVLRVEECVGAGVPQVLAELAELDVHVQILTGDTLDPGLGVPFEGGLSPSDKAGRVGQLRLEGPVVFVGDRPNDLSAMAVADVAVAVPGASPIVAERADLRVDALPALPVAIWAARRLRRRLRHMLMLSLAGNLMGITAAASGVLHPIAAALIMALSSLSVTLMAAPRELR